MLRVVCAVLVEGGKVFVCRRPFEKNEGGKWEFPGGKVESGETDQEALVREIMEELRMKISVRDSIGFSSNDGVTLVAYLAEREGQVIELSEHLEFRWVGPEGGDLLDWASLDIPLWNQLKNSGLI